MFLKFPVSKGSSWPFRTLGTPNRVEDRTVSFCCRHSVSNLRTPSFFPESIFPNPVDFGDPKPFVQIFDFLSSKRLGRNETYHVISCQIHSKRFMFSIHLFVKVYSLYTFMVVVDMQKKSQGDTQLDLLLQHLPPQLQVLRSSTARSSGGEMLWSLGEVV